MVQCVICGLEGCVETQLARDAVKIECAQCGEYEMTGSLLATFKYDKGHKLPHTVSAWIREYYMESGKAPILTTNNILEIAMIPDKPLKSKFERFMRIYYENLSDVKTVIDLNTTPMWLSLTWATDELELKSIIDETIKQGLLEGEIKKILMYETPPKYHWRAHIKLLTFKGREFVESLGQKKADSNKVFLAFHFTDEMKMHFEMTAKRAVSDASGGKLEAVRVGTSSTPTDTKIDDALIGILKASKVVIADFTGQRQAVYYEAGYAMGMGIPVIWTCRADEVDNLSFDTRQYPHILWKDEKDLYKQLTERLSAQIL